MATKFVHVLDRIQEIDRDIAELKEVKAGLNSDRDYCYPVSISIELQMNNLVNERVKLMESPMGDTPPGLNEDKREFERFLRKRQGEFIIETAEELFNDRARDTNTREPAKMIEGTVGDERSVSVSKSIRRSPLTSEKDAASTELPAKKLSRAEILKNLPPAEY